MTSLSVGSVRSDAAGAHSPERLQLPAVGSAAAAAALSDRHKTGGLCDDEIFVAAADDQAEDVARTQSDVLEERRRELDDALRVCRPAQTHTKSTRAVELCVSSQLLIQCYGQSPNRVNGEATKAPPRGARERGGDLGSRRTRRAREGAGEGGVPWRRPHRGDAEASRASAIFDVLVGRRVV